MKIYNYFKNKSQEFTLKNIDETRNYFLEEIKKNELMNKKNKKVCTTLNYIDHFLSYFRSYNYWMHFNCGFCLFDCYSYMNYEFCKGLKVFAITAWIKKYKSMIKKKKKKYDIDTIVSKI